MAGKSDQILETDFALINEDLRNAYDWVLPLLDENNTLPRFAFTPRDLAPFIQNASLFGILYDKDGAPNDLDIRVFGSHIAHDVGEYSGYLASEKLPDVLFRRYMEIANFLVASHCPIRSASFVVGKPGKKTENLIIPVTIDDKIEQGLVFSVYYYD